MICFTRTASTQRTAAATSPGTTPPLLHIPRTVRVGPGKQGGAAGEAQAATQLEPQKYVFILFFILWFTYEPTYRTPTTTAASVCQVTSQLTTPRRSPAVNNEPRLLRHQPPHHPFWTQNGTVRVEQGEQQVRLEPQKVCFFFLSSFCLLTNSIYRTTTSNSTTTNSTTTNVQNGTPTAPKKGPNDGSYRRLGLDMPFRSATSPPSTRNGGSSLSRAPTGMFFPS